MLCKQFFNDNALNLMEFKKKCCLLGAELPHYVIILSHILGIKHCQKHDKICILQTWFSEPP